MTTASESQRRRGRPPKGERLDTRQELLDAALQLFADQGYAATTVRQIAEVVGVRDSAIYGHFSAKQELLDELIAESGPQLLERLGIDAGETAERSPAEALPALACRLVDAWDRPRARMLISLVTREGLVGTQDTLEDLEARLRPAFTAWSERGDLRADLPADQLLWEFVTPLMATRLLYLHGQASRAERKRGRELAHRHVAHFLSTCAIP